MTIADLNNRAARLIGEGKLEKAEGVLADVARALAARDAAASTVDVRDLTPVLDEYFYRVHRVEIGWARAQYAAILDDAKRADALERAMVAACRAAGYDTDDELKDVGFVMGAWSMISVLTRLKRFDEARAQFADVVDDETLFYARVRRDASKAESLLVAGLCVAFESTHDAVNEPRTLSRTFTSMRKLVERARKLKSPETSNLSYAYACYFALVGAVDAGIDELRSAIRQGYDVQSIHDDPDVRALHKHPQWEHLVLCKLFPWSITSQPAGARIFIDDVDTGAVTPARVKPPPPAPKSKRRARRIRLVLAGHADRVDEIHVGAGELSYGTQLESLEHVAALERMADDSKRVPDDVARKKTRAFIGDLSRARVVLERHTTYGLGALRIDVDGDGHARIDKESFGKGDDKGRCEVRVSESRIFDAFVAEAFTEIVIADHAGVADELYFALTLEGAGGTRTLGKFVHTEHARFDRLVRVIHDVVGFVLDKATREKLTV